MAELEQDVLEKLGRDRLGRREPLALDRARSAAAASSDHRPERVVDLGRDAHGAILTLPRSPRAAAARGSGARPRSSTSASAVAYARRRVGVPLEPAQQVGARRVEQVVVLQPGDRVERAPARAPGPPRTRPRRRGSARRPATGRIHEQPPVEQRRSAPSRCLSCVWSSAIAACTWYGPGSPERERAVEHAPALVDRGLVPERRGPARRAARALRRRRHARVAGASRGRASARAARRPPPRPASARRAASRAGSPRRTGRAGRASRPAVAA